MLLCVHSVHLLAEVPIKLTDSALSSIVILRFPSRCDWQQMHFPIMLYPICVWIPVKFSLSSWIMVLSLFWHFLASGHIASMVFKSLRSGSISTLLMLSTLWATEMTVLVADVHCTGLQCIAFVCQWIKLLL